MSRPGVLLLNLGSPDSTSTEDVRAYLEEFLMDERVLDMPWWRRKLILKLFILPKRPAETALAYKEIWTKEGSPLVATSKQQHKLVSEQVDLPVFLGMRYGNPSTKYIVSQIKQEGISELNIMPLYPHYAMSSFETAVEKTLKEIRKQCPEVNTSVHPPFYKDEGYIEALVESALPYLEENDDLLLFSYHGIPERHLLKSDPSGDHCLKTPNCCEVPHPCQASCYRHQCFETTKSFLKKSGVPKEKTAIAFQSRILRDPWLSPYTDQELKRFAKSGIKKIKVICPSFVTDCLETLEEIGMRGVEDFLQAGGESLRLIPCLNTHPKWIDFLAKKIKTWQANLPS